MKINKLVLSGGGIGGVAYCGVFRCLEELSKSGEIELDIKELYCVSVGCLFGLAYCIGYNSTELLDEIVHKNFKKLTNVSVINFMNNYGIDDAQNIIKWVESLVIKKGVDKNITFLELYNKCKIEYKIYATNLTSHQFECFDNIKTPNMGVITAIRLSISIPFIFTAQRWNNDIYVDGSLINNYPIQLINDKRNTLGIRLTSNEIDKKNEINDINSFAKNITLCLLTQKEKQLLEWNEDYKKITINIETGDSQNAINFVLKKSDKLELFRKGYYKTCNYFKNMKA